MTYSGTVTGLGSIVVNGVRFSTIGANTTDDDAQSYSSAFALGSSVTVTGTIDPATGTMGQATAIVVHGGVRGEASSASGTSDAGTFVVAGQTIQVDTNTLFEGLTFDSLNANWVEVHGILGANNVLLASRVEKESAPIPDTYGYSVLGRISNLRDNSFDLALSDTKTLSVPTAAFKGSVNLSNGLSVRVLSKVDPSEVSGTLDATTTKVLLKGERNRTGETKIRGAITATAPDLMVNDILVETNSNTKWDEGLALSALAVGQVIKVEGRMSNGRLLAREIETDAHEHKSRTGKYEDRVKLYGVVTDSNDTDDTFVVQGVTVKDPDGAPPSNGSYVEVKASFLNGVLTAHEVEMKNKTSPSSRFETYGTASCDNPDLSGLRTQFTLITAGGSTLTVNGSAAREVKYDKKSGDTGGTNSYNCFLEVEGNVNDGVIQATKIEVKQRAIAAPAN